MHYRRIEQLGTAVSEIGLGCWQLGGADWGDMPEERAVQILQAAVDSNTNFFDTADVYGLGRSETIIGKFLRARPGVRPFVATKLGRFPDPGMPGNFSMPVFRQHVEASLQRLQVESLDLVQLHCIPTEVLRRGACFDWLRTLKQQGKIRAYGASVETMEEAKICLMQGGLASLQIIFNLFRQEPAEEIFEAARQKGVALIIRLPLASGLLSGTITKETKFPDNDHRLYNRHGEKFSVGETFSGLGLERGVELSQKLAELVPPGMTMGQMALRWILDHPAVTTVIPGASRPEQAVDNARVSDLPKLAPELREKLAAFFRQHMASRA